MLQICHCNVPVRRKPSKRARQEETTKQPVKPLQTETQPPIALQHCCTKVQKVSPLSFFGPHLLALRIRGLHDQHKVLPFPHQFRTHFVVVSLIMRKAKKAWDIETTTAWDPVFRRPERHEADHLACPSRTILCEVYDPVYQRPEVHLHKRAILDDLLQLSPFCRM